MKTVRIQVGNIMETELEVRSISILNEETPVRIVNAWDDNVEYIPSTLRDISIIMNQMVGQGVGWQLANELNDKLELNDAAHVLKILLGILGEYSDLSDEEAIQRFEDNTEPTY